MLRKLDISYEQFRSVVIEAIGQNPQSQFANLVQDIAKLALKKGLAPAPAPGIFSGGDEKLCGTDCGLVQDVMWDLIVEGVLRPGLGDGMNANWPFYHLSDWGKKAITASGPTPYDPDGYLSRLQRDIPDLDPVILAYLTESLHTFRIGCLLSSTIALGCASEKALLVLIEAYANWLPASSQKKFRESTEGKMIKRQFEALRKSIDGLLRAKLPGDLEDGLDVELNSIFDIIRNQRNDAGHPTGKAIERERAYANLSVVPVYLKKVYAIIDWLGANVNP